MVVVVLVLLVVVVVVVVVVDFPERGRPDKKCKPKARSQKPMRSMLLAHCLSSLVLVVVIIIGVVVTRKPIEKQRCMKQKSVKPMEK